MTASHFLGVDVGTSACKTTLLDGKGRVLVTHSYGYPTRTTPQGEVTQDPSVWLRAAAATMRACVADSGGVSVDGIAVTAPAHVGVLLDRDDQPLTRSLLAFDGRPEAVVQSLREEIGPEFFERTFIELSAGWTLAQLVWRRNELGARAWSRVSRLALQKDFVRMSMTGDLATDPSDAAGTAMFDQRAGAWAEDLCRTAGLSVEQLPPVRPAFAIGGGLTRSWSRRSGILAGTPVAIGATDTVVELLSVDAIRPGDTIVKIASTGTIVNVTGEPRPHRGLLTYPHAAAPGRWYSAAATSTAATAYSWCNGILEPDGARLVPSYSKQEAAARRLPPGSEGLLFLPFLEGERVPYWDSRLRGAFLGLSSGHRREHFLRAVMEGVALSLRDCLELMGTAGATVKVPTFTGGGTRSSLWRQILASALGMPGELVRPHGPSIGAALLAQSAVCGTAAQPRVRRSQITPPDGWVDAYQRLYRIYREAAVTLTNVSHELAEVAVKPER